MHVLFPFTLLKRFAFFPLRSSAPLRETILIRIVASAALIAICVNAKAEDFAIGLTVPDPAKVIGPDQCAKCHQQEVQQWMQTPHFATFDALHRAPRAKEIADKLGERSIKRSPTCTQCH
jgi:hypothetical protein